jgi:hypothetical protein
LFEPFIYNVLFLVVHFQFRLSKRLDARFLSQLSLGKQGCLLNLVLVGLSDIVLDLLCLLLALQLSDLLTLQVVLHLSLDELALKHLLLQIFDEVKFEFVKLIRDGLRIFHLLIVFFLQLLAHAQVVLLHLLLL